MSNQPDRYLTYTYDTQGNLMRIDEVATDARAIVATYRYENDLLISTIPDPDGADG